MTYPTITRRFLIGVTVLLAGLTVLAPVQAQENPPTPPTTETKPVPAVIESGAREVLTKMTAAYRTVPALSLVVDTVGQAGKEKVEAHLEIFLKRPNKFLVRTAIGSAVADGSNLYVIVPNNGTVYTKDPLPKNTTFGMIFNGIGPRIAGLPNTMLSNLLSTPDFLSGLLSGDDIASCKLIGTDQLDGVTVDRVEIKIKANDSSGSLLFFIGQRDHLVRRVIAEGSNPDGPIKVTENHTSVKTYADLPANTFTFKAPKGAREAKRKP